MRLPSSAFLNVPKPGAQGLQLSSKRVSVNPMLRRPFKPYYAESLSWLSFRIFPSAGKSGGDLPTCHKVLKPETAFGPIMTRVSLIQKNSMAPYNNYGPVV